MIEQLDYRCLGVDSTSTELMHIPTHGLATLPYGVSRVWLLEIRRAVAGKLKAFKEV